MNAYFDQPDREKAKNLFSKRAVNPFLPLPSTNTLMPFFLSQIVIPKNINRKIIRDMICK